ncbi:hypothetical protein RCL1_002497 [Eukaryota sp. TZLM3-RCL]
MSSPTFIFIDASALESSIATDLLSYLYSTYSVDNFSPAISVYHIVDNYIETGHSVFKSSLWQQASSSLGAAFHDVFPTAYGKDCTDVALSFQLSFQANLLKSQYPGKEVHFVIISADYDFPASVDLILDYKFKVTLLVCEYAKDKIRLQKSPSLGFQCFFIEHKIPQKDVLPLAKAEIILLSLVPLLNKQDLDIKGLSLRIQQHTSQWFSPSRFGCSDMNELVAKLNVPVRSDGKFDLNSFYANAVSRG